MHEDVKQGHGRIEVRNAWTLSDPSLIQHLRGANRFSALTTLVRVRAERYIEGQKPSLEDRYFIGSSTPQAHQALGATRTHWHIENSLHWLLDVAFREDESRLPTNHGAQNFALLRHIAINALQQDTSSKLGIKNKRLKAGWDDSFLLSILNQLLFYHIVRRPKWKVRNILSTILLHH